MLIYSLVKESSIIAVQIFDQRKFKKKDQGFLGVINCRVGDVLDLQLGGDGKRLNTLLTNDRNADEGFEKVE